MSSVRMTIAAALLMAASGITVAKLPPPTPEEAAKAAQAKERAKQAAAAHEAATRRAQDRVAERYIAAMKAKGVTVKATPLDEQPTAAVTTAPGKTPAESDTGEAPERKSADKGGKSSGDATHADAGKDSDKRPATGHAGL
ncbi:MAG: hypothetical protein IT531_22835 [Burkholderiales bacterium]|nr:hypothetical protein [Burkholderiales bacterium]